MAERLRSWLSSTAAFEEVVIDEVGNVIAYSGSGPYLLLCSHLDTVPGQLKVEFRDGSLFGRGAVDAKGPLVAMAAAATQCAKAGVRDLLFAGVVGEERDSRGIKHILSKHQSYIGGVFGEPTNGSKIAVSYRGRLGLTITSRASPSHPGGYQFDGNPIEDVVNLATSLKEDLKRMDCRTTLTRINGGVADNVTPPNCILSVDIRVPQDRSLTEVENIARTRSSEKIQVEIYESIPPVNVGRANVVFHAAACAVSEAGGEPTAVAKMGTCDMNHFHASTGLPCVALGPGDSSLSHTDTESILLSDFHRSIDVYSRLIRKLRAKNPAVVYSAN